MGKRRRAQKKIVTKKKQFVSKVFKCPMCSVDNSVQAKLNFKDNIGHLECKNCKKKFETKINYLSEPIDIFSEWLDQIDAENSKAPSSSSNNSRNDNDYNITASSSAAPKSKKRDRSGRARRNNDDEDEDDEDDENRKEINNSYDDDDD